MKHYQMERSKLIIKYLVIGNVEKKLQQFLLWGSALVCLFAGIYVALNATYLLFDQHNFYFAPWGDDAHDAATRLYPILLGKEKFTHIFRPFADHRVVIGRLFTMVDYLYTNGTQATLSWRVSILFWLNSFLFIGFIVLRNKYFHPAVKILLSGVVLALTFSGSNISNYFGTIMVTWPFALLFAFLAFVSTERYCSAYEVSLRWKYVHQGFIILFVFLALLTFNIWLILWPIIFLILIKRQCFRFPSALIWILIALASYKFYFSGKWTTATAGIGLKSFLHHPIDMFLYLSRVLSISLVPDATTKASQATIFIAIFILAFSLWWLIKLFKKTYWSSDETILFACFTYVFFAVLLIATARFWMPAEAAAIGARFTTPGCLLTICILTTSFIVIKENTLDQLIANTGLSMLVMVWLLAFFLPGNKLLMFNDGFINQVLTLEATGIPINEAFIEQTKPINNEFDGRILNYLNDMQKKYQKGVYSFWAAQQMRKNISELNFNQVNCDEQVKFELLSDFQREKVQGLMINTRLEKKPSLVSANWSLLFTDKHHHIVGFGISAPADHANLWRNVILSKPKEILWRGAVNLQLLRGEKEMMVWAVDSNGHQGCRMGRLNI